MLAERTTADSELCIGWFVYCSGSFLLAQKSIKHRFHLSINTKIRLLLSTDFTTVNKNYLLLAIN